MSQCLHCCTCVVKCAKGLPAFTCFVCNRAPARSANSPPVVRSNVTGNANLVAHRILEKLPAVDTCACRRLC